MLVDFSGGIPTATHWKRSASVLLFTGHCLENVLIVIEWQYC